MRQDAVISFGAAAEDEAIKLMRSDDFSVLNSAVQILKQVGTKKCLPTLNDHARSRSSVSYQAKRAADEIRDRIQQERGQ
jgi:hypothetical protein